jgi:hypothetical protein
MITVHDAFVKFRSKLELSPGERKDASSRQQEIRAVMKRSFDVEHDFLTGSYARWTKTKPLKDVDIFCVLGDDERPYRDKSPSVLLSKVEETLAKDYGSDCVSRQRRSVTVDFGVVEDENGETGEKVMSFDVVPAFTLSDYYEIPDTAIASGWTKTDPRVHYDKALAAQKAYNDQWKFLVRLAKAWNRNNGKPIKPSFLIEVMALDILYGGFGGDYRREIQGLFASLADRISEHWPDPAGLGPDVSDSMDSQKCAAARSALLAAGNQMAHAIRLEREGKNGDALRAWRALFGRVFPLS